ncbi:alpha-galactosidase [Luethyella okanaganae]|uniref:Alpha-galactosidase n=1 Tax=Luethyella okanaganae TaxID=69372 RepID=A0ABW1VCT4_9MICO
MQHPPGIVSLEAGGVALLLDCRDGALPAVVHWGFALGEHSDAELVAMADAAVPLVVSNLVDEPMRVSILPEHASGWVGRPGLVGSRSGTAWSPSFEVSSVELDDGAVTDGTVVVRGTSSALITAVDREARLGLELTIELARSGLLRLRASVRNDADEPYAVDELNLVLPTPLGADEVLDFAGRWGNERVPQRQRMGIGTHLREGRKGRTGADAATLLCVGSEGFSFREGDIWSIHLGYSGNHRHYAERLFHGVQVLGGGEILLPGEVSLGRGERYTSPWLYASYGRGLDEVAARFHDHLRGREGRTVRPRPVTLNVWEAVYFDHDLERLKRLAGTAADLGVERFVLDDGWFRRRRDDSAGLGDWYVDEEVWPNGLAPLVDHVRSLGMEFGLWFEPEMVSPDSDLARAHPEWIMATGGRWPVASRRQQVLNLGLPDAYRWVKDRMLAILGEYDIGHIKWDHNRDLIEAGTQPGGAPGVHAQTLATYRLMDELKLAHPLLEIEACSSGGARVDLGVLDRADRVWASDCIDPLERQRINRWTMQLIPPELVGSHVSSERSHTTGRRHDLAFRAGTALFGHFGVEWDLDTASDAERAELARWIALYRRERGLLHSGRVVRIDTADPTLWIHGVVARDRSEALFALVYRGRSTVSPRGRFTLAGLDPDRRYSVEAVPPGDRPHGLVSPHWLSTPEPSVYSGRALEQVGLQTPEADPEQLLVLRVAAGP